MSASIGSRIMASLIDVLITFGPALVLLQVGTKAGDIPADGGDLDQYTTTGNWMSWICIGLLLGTGLYQLYREGSTGQSIGKRIVGIETLSAEDLRPLGFEILLRPYLVDSIVVEIGERQAPARPARRAPIQVIKHPRVSSPDPSESSESSETRPPEDFTPS